MIIMLRQRGYNCLRPRWSIRSLTTTTTRGDPVNPAPKKEIHLSPDQRLPQNLPPNPQRGGSSTRSQPLWNKDIPEIPTSAIYNQRTYFVKRTKTNNLPVYLDFKHGGNKIITILRNIEGDALLLKKDIIDSLQIPEKKVAVTTYSRQIRITGNYKTPLLELLSKHF